MKTDTFYLYSDRTDVSLTCYLPDDSEEMLGGRKRPGVIICPGGAYVFCSDREAEPVAMRFLAMGYHAFVLRYSTFHGAEGRKWPEHVYDIPEPKAETVYPAPLIELGRSMQIIRQHADTWLVDETKTGICGFSAGGHNCALYSCCWNRPPLTEALQTEAEALRPAFCILGYPFIDYFYNMQYPFDPYTKASYQ